METIAAKYAVALTDWIKVELSFQHPTLKAAIERTIENAISEYWVDQGGDE